MNLFTVKIIPSCRSTCYSRRDSKLSVSIETIIRWQILIRHISHNLIVTIAQEVLVHVVHMPYPSWALSSSMFFHTLQCTPLKAARLLQPVWQDTVRMKHSGAIAETLLRVWCVPHLEDHVQQHIKPCLPRVFGGNVGWREVKHIGPCLSADCMYQHLLAHSSWASNHERFDMGGLLMYHLGAYHCKCVCVCVCACVWRGVQREDKAWYS